MNDPTGDPIDIAVELLSGARSDLDAGETTSSLDKAERARAILEVNCGSEHPDVANAYLAIGTAHEADENHDAAHAAYRSAMSIMDHHSDALDPDDHRPIARLRVQAHTAVGNIERIRGHFDAAHATLSHTVTIAQDALGATDPDTGWALNALGIVCKYAGRFAEGAVYYRRALAIIEANEGPDSTEAAIVWHNIGGLAFDAGNYAEAVESTRRAVQRSEAAFGGAHPNVAADLAALAAALDALGEHQEAAELNQRAFTILERLPGTDYDLATLHNNIGVAASDRGDATMAEDHYRRALVIKERIFGPDHPDVAMTLHNLGALAADNGDDAGATLLLQRALKIFETSLGADHSKTNRCRAALESATHEP